MARAPDLTPAELAAAHAALAKEASGQPLTVRERTALAKYRRRNDDADRDRLLGAVPKWAYLELAGRTAQAVNRHAAKYGAPLRGRHVDLAELVAWIHDFLDAHAARLAADPDAPDAQPELRKLRAERARLAELDRMEREGDLVPRADVRACFDRVASVFRLTAVTIKKTWPDAADALTKAIDDASRDPFFSATTDDAPAAE